MRLSGRSQPSGPPCSRVATSSSSFLPCAISWVSLRVRIDASARLTVYSSGCACDGSGPGGGRLSCWSSRRRSPVGIVKGFGGCWRRRSRRRPGRPRNDLQLRKLIGRMATENCLWGAPRIHGEVLKLGIVVSERTVSRYLPNRLTRRSQTWRTFLANHIGNLAFASTVTASFATSDDDVDALVLPCRPVPPSRDRRYASNRWGLVDWPPSLQSTSLGWRVAQHQLRRRTRFSTGKDPPTSWAVNLSWPRMGDGSLR
jgi:hypothetical protein